jgi:hypothetical protein
MKNGKYWKPYHFYKLCAAIFFMLSVASALIGNMNEAIYFILASLFILQWRLA